MTSIFKDKKVKLEENVVIIGTQEVVNSHDNKSDFHDSSLALERNDDLKVMESSESVVGVTLSIGTRDTSVKNEDCMGILAHKSSDLHDSSDEILHQHERAVTTHVQDASIKLPHEGTRDLGINGVMCDVDSCHLESDFSDQTLDLIKQV